MSWLWKALCIPLLFPHLIITDCITNYVSTISSSVAQNQHLICILSIYSFKIQQYLFTISRIMIFSPRKCCCCTTRHTEFSSPPGNLYDTRYISIKKRRQNKRLRGFFKWIIHRRYRKLMKTNSIVSCAHSFCSFRFFLFGLHTAAYKSWIKSERAERRNYEPI